MFDDVYSDTDDDRFSPVLLFILLLQNTRILRKSIINCYLSINFNHSEDEEDEDGENFSRGVHSFINAASKRRKQRNLVEKIAVEDIGVENRIIGAVTFKKTYMYVSIHCHIAMCL